MLIFVPGDLDLWPWPSNESKRGTKRLLREFGANPFSRQTKKKTDGAKNRTFHTSLHAVITTLIRQVLQTMIIHDRNWAVLANATKTATSILTAVFQANEGQPIPLFCSFYPLSKSTLDKKWHRFFGDICPSCHQPAVLKHRKKHPH